MQHFMWACIYGELHQVNGQRGWRLLQFAEECIKQAKRQAYLVNDYIHVAGTSPRLFSAHAFPTSLQVFHMYIDGSNANRPGSDIATSSPFHRLGCPIHENTTHLIVFVNSTKTVNSVPLRWLCASVRSINMPFVSHKSNTFSFKKSEAFNRLTLKTKDETLQMYRRYANVACGRLAFRGHSRSYKLTHLA